MQSLARACRRKGMDFLSHYPVNAGVDIQENVLILQQHNKALSAEVSKSKPRDSVLLPFYEIHLWGEHLRYMSTWDIR